MKKMSMIGVLCTLLLLASCAPNVNEEEELLQNEETQENTAIVPSSQISNEYYRIVLPYQPAAARGAITNQIANRVDIDEVEEGLMRHSMDVFPTDQYYFQEGQYLDYDTVLSMIDENNPQLTEEQQGDEQVQRDNPRILSHILEQNYLVETGDNTVELGGISIGIALKSVYQFQTETGGPYYYEDISRDEMMAQGEEVAQVVLNELRQLEGLGDIPIMIGLYAEEDQNSLVPGNYIAKQTVSGGETELGNWEDINENYVLFPSPESSEYVQENETIMSFGSEVRQFFPNYVGVVGEGFYANDELRSLSIDIPIQFYSQAEVIGFTQYIYGLAQDMFSNYYNLEINVNSSAGKESVIYQEAGGDTLNVHVFN